MAGQSITLPAMFTDPSFTRWLTLHGFVTTVAVLVYVINSHVMHQRRQPAAAIAWMLFILFLPYLALPAFLLFGSRKLPRPLPTALPRPDWMQGMDAWAVETIAALGQPAPAHYHALQLHQDGCAAREAVLGMIDGAQYSIDVSTFLLRLDDLGAVVLSALCRKAELGLRVRLLVDGLGSLLAGGPNLQRLVKAGGAVTLFVPPLRSPLKGRTNLRNHRKLLIVDGDQGARRRLWCGGRNLAAEYFDGAPGSAGWRDLSFDVSGPLVQQAQTLFHHDWAFANGQTLAAPLVPASTEFVFDGAQLVASGPDQSDDTVHALLVTAAYRARQRIALVTPYFVPDAQLLMSLCMAARRGVQVDLLVPARSNHRLSDLAGARALRTLAQAGAHIWLTPGMMHGKLVVVDEMLALAGSANLDARSLFLNYELMCAFHQPQDVRRFHHWFEQERLPASRYVPVAPGLIRDGLEGMLLWMGFQL